MTISAKHVSVFALALIMLAAAVSAAVIEDFEIKVVNKAGTLIKTAEVTLAYSNGTKIDGCDEETTGNDGIVTCDEFLEGKDLAILVTANGYKDIDDDSTLEDIDGNDDWEKMLVVMRAETGVLEVEVVDEKGDPVDGADVTLKSLDADKSKADFDGNYDAYVFPGEKTKYEGFDVDTDEDTQDTDGDGIAEFEGIQFSTKYNITVKKGTAYMPTWVEFSMGADDDDVKITLGKPGTAKYAAIVKDKTTERAIEGATLTMKNKATGEEKTAKSNGDGRAELTVPTPGDYDITVTKSGYSTASQNNIHLTNDATITSPFYIIGQNKGPVAKAGDDQVVMVGQEVKLDGSGSSDPDGTQLTFAWKDSMGGAIPGGATPSFIIDTAGTHTITLTVSDGTVTATDEVIITAESAQNCGDGVCSIAERQFSNCPKDCPVCLDNVCGAGEATAFNDTALYCPVDCGVAGVVRIGNTTALIAGNTTIVTFLDPATQQAILGGSVQVTMPNGTVAVVKMVMGRATVAFPEAGTYTLQVTAEKYVGSGKTVEVIAGSSDMLMWILVIVVAAVLALFLIRYINLMFKKRGSKGYRAYKYRRSKPTLSTI